ncbi:MAG TPA: ATP-binding protein [Steroidobacteraceae bacterium]|nr:ATP-binding protein [Steroidobacteraceae bacterium]
MRESTHRWLFDGVAIGYGALVLLLLPWVAAPIDVPSHVIGVYGLAVCAADLCTAILLIRQYRLEGHGYLLVLLGAYLLSGLLVLPMAFSFPGAFGAGQLLGHEMTAAVLFLTWRIAGALLLFTAVMFGIRPSAPHERPVRNRRALGIGVLTALAAVGFLVLSLWLPVEPMQHGRFNLSSFIVGGLVAAISLAGAIIAFSTRSRAGSLFGWVALVMVATVGEMLLSTLSGGRFTMGWYVSRCITVISSYLLLAYLAADFARDLAHRPMSARKYSYVAATALAICAVLMRYFLTPWLGGSSRYGMLFGAVAIAVWLGGWRPGVLTAVLGYVLVQAFLTPGEASMLDTADLMGLVLYAVSCAVIIALGHNLRSARERSRLAEERFRKSQEAAIQGYGLLRAVRDDTGKVRDFVVEYVNPRGAALAGKTPETVVGRRLTEVLPGVTRNHVFETLRDVTETGRPLEVELRYEEHGRSGWFRNMIVKVDDGVAVSFFDVTRARKLENELAQRAYLLERADSNKSRFLATLSHELRNPLAPLRNGMAILKKHGNPEHSAVLVMMDRQLKQMVHLVDDLLDVSRIDRGKIELRRERVPVDAVVSAAIDTARPSIDSKSHELVVRFAHKALHVEGDPVRLAQIVSNLLINAAKFTSPKGRIELSLRGLDGQLEIIVRDNGIGIEPAELPRVFEMFVQLGQGGEGAGGLGLGLALVKSLVDLHGGRVEARSEGRGKGAEFVVLLPLAAAPSQPSAVLPVVVSTPTLRRVLVVDDNEDAAQTLGALLRAQGHEVRVYFNAREALQAAIEALPDVAFLDLNMPVMDGFALAQKLRMLPGGASVTLVAVTGMGRQEDHARSRDAGFDLHLTKPADPEVVIRIAAQDSSGEANVVPFTRPRAATE